MASNLEYYTSNPWPIVVMFHSVYDVLDRSDVFHNIGATKSQILNFTEFAKKHFEFIDEKFFLENLDKIHDNDNNPFYGKILYTFDDGYKNISILANDFLRLNIRPIVFLSAGLQTGEVINWPAKIALLFRRNKLGKYIYRNEEYDFSEDNKKTLLYQRIDADVKILSKVEFLFGIEELIKQDSSNSDFSAYDDDMLFLSKEDILSLQGKGWSFGSHAYTHYALDSMAVDEVEQELVNSKQFIKREYGIDAKLMSYPLGCYNDAVVNIASCHFSAAFDATYSRFTEKNYLYKLPRFSFPGDEILIRQIYKIPNIRKELFLDKKFDVGLKKHVTNSIRLFKLVLNENERKILINKFLRKFEHLPNDSKIYSHKGVRFKKKKSKICSKINSKPKIAFICGADVCMRKMVSEISTFFDLTTLIIQNIGKFKINAIRNFEDISFDFFPYLKYDNVSQEILLGKKSLAWFINENTNVFSTQNVNHSIIPSLLLKDKPDLIFVFGTTMIKNPKILELNIPVINMHWGMSPLYRGSYTLEWAILNNEIENVGVTFHKLDSGIDSGPILKRKKIDLDGSESMRDVSYKATLLEIETVKEICNEWISNYEFKTIVQDINKGHLYFKNEWSKAREFEVEKILKDGFVFNNKK